MSVRRSASPDSARELRRARSLLPLAWLIVACLATAASAADPAPTTASREKPATLEVVPGKANKRVILSAKAAERLDIKLGAVGERVIVPTQVFGGIVVDASTAGAGQLQTPAKAGGAAALWVRVGVSPSEWGRLDKTRPARILPLETRTGIAPDISALPVERPQQESTKSGMVPLYFIIQQDATGLVIGNRVRVELPLEGGGGSKKTVPNTAVYYDAKGDAWVYVGNGPLAFMRERIEVERVAGDLAVVTSGPPVGTPVVTVGVSLLYGVEVFGK